ncbi:MAG: ketopantoate reductase family protein [Asgard group archaeon]|nr:ketopantoate reductase family protein [Asgard group archaeon]
MNGEKMFLVMGSGSVGSFFGGLIATKHHEVHFIGRKDHIEEINKKGLQIIGLKNKCVKIIGYTSVKAFQQANNEQEIEYVLLTTKAHQTLEAATQLKPILSDKATIIAIQNGIGTEDIIKQIFPKNTVLRGTTSIGVCRPKPGVIEFTGDGITLIGFRTEKEKTKAKIFVDMMKIAGINANIEPNILGAVFSKTIVNCALNPLTAIYQVKNIEVYNNPELRKLATKLATEAWNVAIKSGINLSIRDPIEYTFEIIKKTGENTNSMLNDILNKRKTEIDFLNGKIIELGEEVGVDVSTNLEIYNKIKSLEKS